MLVVIINWLNIEQINKSISGNEELAQEAIRVYKASSVLHQIDVDFHCRGVDKA